MIAQCSFRPALAIGLESWVQDVGRELAQARDAHGRPRFCTLAELNLASVTPSQLACALAQLLAAECIESRLRLQIPAAQMNRTYRSLMDVPTEVSDELGATICVLPEHLSLEFCATARFAAQSTPEP